MKTGLSTHTVLDGKQISQTVLELLKGKIETLRQHQKITPKLVVVRVGEDPASKVYVEKKAKTAREIGLHSDVIVLDEHTEQTTLCNLIDRLNADSEVHAILVQLPIPGHIHTQTILNRVSPHKDVDGFHPVNLGTLMAGKMPVAPPCTPAGVMKLLEVANIPLEGQHAVIVGRSAIVGKPLGMMLLNNNATVTYCHSKTRNLAAVTSQADILVAAVGKAHLICGEHVKPGAVVIDVGINRVDSKLVGDVEFETVAPKASFITPVPGGVGPMTIAMLMANTVALCEASLKPHS